MAKDDYFVVAYRLLKYLYNCLKAGEPPRTDVLNADTFAVNENYWAYILRHLYVDGYIGGMAVFDNSGGLRPNVTITPYIEITPKGIQYLQESSAFQKAKAAAKDTAAIIP